MRKTDPELLKNVLVPRKQRLYVDTGKKSSVEVKEVKKVEKPKEVKEVEVEVGKRCKTCQEVKQTSEFYKVGKYYMSSCKVCQNKARQELRKKKKAEVKPKEVEESSVAQTEWQEELKKPELVRQENEEVVEEQERSSARESESESEESSGAQTEEEEDLSIYNRVNNESFEQYYNRLKKELGSDAPKKKKNESFEDYYNKVQELIIAYSEGSQ